MLMKCTFLIILVLQVNWCRGAFQNNVLQESSLNTELLTDLEDNGPTLKIVKKRSPDESINSTTVESVQVQSTNTSLPSESPNKEPSSGPTVKETSSDETSTKPSSDEPIPKTTSETPTTQPTTATVSAKPSTEVTTEAAPLQSEADVTPKVIEEITEGGNGVDNSTQKVLSDVPESSSNGTSDITNVGDKAIEAIQGIGEDILESVGNLSTVGFQWITGLLHMGSELLIGNGQPEAGKVTETTKQT